MSDSNKTRNVPLWILRETADTLRMVANALESPKRESCLDRNVMRSWNHVNDLIRGHTTSISESLSYYSEVGQMPSINE